MEALGFKIRRQRRQLGLTVEELAGRAGISKPYLSIIETGRAPNPPSDDKLRRLEGALKFTPGELVAQAHLQRTPGDVRAVLRQLMRDAPLSQTISSNAKSAVSGEQKEKAAGGQTANLDLRLRAMVRAISGSTDTIRVPDLHAVNSGKNLASIAWASESIDAPLGLAGAVSPDAIGRMARGDPKVSPYIGCPDVDDPRAFAARVGGNSMLPKYRSRDIVIFSPGALARDGDDCLVRFDDGRAAFRRIFFDIAKDGSSVLRLQPRNQRYKTQTVEREKIAELYRAVFRYQRVDEEPAR